MFLEMPPVGQICVVGGLTMLAATDSESNGGRRCHWDHGYSPCRTVEVVELHVDTIAVGDVAACKDAS